MHMKQIKFRRAPKTEFAARVQQALTYAGLGQTDAARALTKRLGRNISQATIGNIAINAHESLLSYDLADLCGVDAGWLIHNKGPAPGENRLPISYQVNESAPATLHPRAASDPSEQLQKLIKAGALSDRDIALLLEMATSMAKHARKSA